MEQVRALEKTISGWYANAPHLPVNARKWLANNVWWLAVVGIVLSAFAILSIIGILVVALGLSAFVATSVYSAPYAGAVVGATWLVSLIGLVGLVITVALLAMAVGPLKAKAKKGWTILFVIALISLAVQVVGDLVTFNLAGILVAVLWTGIGAYFLFEIRDEFGVQKVAAKAKVPKKA